MTYKDLINQWFYRAIAESDPFTRYIFIYLSFIAFLSQEGTQTSDRGRINRVKEVIEAKEYYLRLVRNKGNLRDILSNLVEELKRQPIRNSTRNNDTHWSGADGVLDGTEDWENLVEFWYRVRNNLFHGHKAPEFERDIRLVNYAYLTLQPFMRNFIDHDLFWEFD